MKSFLIIVLSFQAGPPADRWLSSDKVQHFFMGAFVQSASFSLLQAAGVDKAPALVAASGLSATAAFGKELRDRNGSGRPSVKDGVWTLAGAAAISPVLARTK